jgi:hypothetical protein
MNGECRLCKQEKALRDSHVFPKGAYRRYVADKKKGGSFANLKEMNLRSNQFTRFWFCRECENRFDKQGEDIFFKIADAKAPGEISYGDLYYFAVSVSWRSSLFYFETHDGRECVADALERWRLFLLGEADDVEPFSQYLLSIHDATWGPWNRGLGGFTMPTINHSFALIGPFIVLGITRAAEWSDVDRATLEPARLKANGDTIQFDNAMTQAAREVKHIKTAITYWQSVSANLLAKLGDK